MKNTVFYYIIENVYFFILFIYTLFDYLKYITRTFRKHKSNYVLIQNISGGLLFFGFLLLFFIFLSMGMNAWILIFKKDFSSIPLYLLNIYLTASSIIGYGLVYKHMRKKSSEDKHDDAEIKSLFNFFVYFISTIGGVVFFISGIFILEIIKTIFNY